MAQTAYTGIQGSGKSFEVVRNVILPNVAKGRRVVTNVAGLKIDLINQYCVDKLGADPKKLGEIVQVENERIEQPDFFPVEITENVVSTWFKTWAKACGVDLASMSEEEKRQKWNERFVVQGGDVVILDECWRWYVTGEKLPDGHLTFFRMHRHFTHPVTGQCCDIVLIVQDIADLRRNIRATVEKSYLMHKQKDLGMPNTYLVSIYSGKNQTPRALTEQENHKYDPEIFPLYSSYSQSTAAGNKEEQADKRGNVFNRKLFKIGIPLAIIGICGGAYNGWKFFHPTPKEIVADTKAKGDGQQAQPSQAEQPKKSGPVISDQWRVVGLVMSRGKQIYMLADSTNRVRYLIDPPNYKVSGQEIELLLPNGDAVSYWSGSAPSSMIPGMRK